MMLTKKQTGPLPHTFEIAEEAQPEQMPMKMCPFCDTPVTFTIISGDVMLDWHRDKHRNHEQCAGSDYNWTAAQ